MIDDACEALGTLYNGRPIAAHGQDAVFAFYPNKQLTMGEGGVVTTHSEATWRLLKSMRNQGRADSGGWLEHARLGFNYRLDDVRAAIGIGQLEKLEAILAGRTQAADRYTRLLDGIDGLELACPDDQRHVRSWFVYVVALPAEADRERVFERGYRAAAAGSMAAGSGLGLFISAEIVRRHGGTIRCDAAPGGGTIVEVRLPLVGAGEAPEPVEEFPGDRARYAGANGSFADHDYRDRLAGRAREERFVRAK